MKLTVFTPTYNRRDNLINLYNSILKQKISEDKKCDMEWLIVDDGSSDGTKEKINELINENKIVIRYFYKENGGKHTAHNFAVDHASGEYIMICDSDDILTQNAISLVCEAIEKTCSDKNIAGMVGYRNLQTENGEKSNIQCKFPHNVEYSKLNDLFKEEGVFDTVQIYKTSVLRKYKFPEYDGELFFPENWCWRTIDKFYDIFVIQKVLEEGKYQEDGLSIGKGSSMTDPFRNPNAYADYSFLYYETSYKIIKKIWYYGKYKAFQKFGGETNHKENIVLNAVSFPVQIYWRIKYMKK